MYTWKSPSQGLLVRLLRSRPIRNTRSSLAGKEAPEVPRFSHLRSQSYPILWILGGLGIDGLPNYLTRKALQTLNTSTYAQTFAVSMGNRKTGGEEVAIVLLASPGAEY